MTRKQKGDCCIAVAEVLKENCPHFSSYQPIKICKPKKQFQSIDRQAVDDRVAEQSEVGLDLSKGRNNRTYPNLGAKWISDV